MRQLLAFAAALGWLFCSSASFAAEAATSVQLLPGGGVKIVHSYAAPNGCYSAGRASVGTPAGTIPIADAIPVTLELVHSGAAACIMVITPVTWEIVLPDVPSDAVAIILYMQDSHAGRLTARAVALARP